MQPSAPITSDLVLVGGGHAHALVLRELAMNPQPGLRITLISPDALTPYSGMLPGLLAGHYTLEETHIDLVRLCQWGGVRFYADRVLGLDPRRRVLCCEQRGDVHYDLLSIDIGSQPEMDSVPGAREYAVPVKPVSSLWARWQSLALNDTAREQRIAIVGGGAGSVEIALAVAHRLQARKPRIALYCGNAQVLQGYANRTRQSVMAAFAEQGVSLHCGSRVSEVMPARMHFDSGESDDFDHLIWCTGAAASPWVADSGLPTDERGFMLVEDSLHSTAFDNVFGAGDIAVQHRHPRPKAGVYAVRQGPVLARNLLAKLQGKPLRQHHPQTRFLSMLALGPRRAVAERNGVSLSGDWVWRWKDRIDQAFMNRFSELPSRRMQSPPTGAEGRQAPCGGCGAKVGADVLQHALAELRERYPALIVTPSQRDDAVLVELSEPLVQSLDVLRALIDDPWLMGKLAAQHALSDLYASGAQPHSAQALITLPFSAPALLHRDLLLCLEGALKVFEESECRLLGGHSMQGPEFQIGFAVNGTLRGEPLLRNTGGRPGDALVLTKALGTGTLFAAHMQARADGRDIQAALDSMLVSNASAATVARDHGARALTDVTGFGLAGHLLGLLGDELNASVVLDRLPMLTGVEAAMQAGIFSTAHEANREAFSSRCDVGSTPSLRAELLFDPQTCGGLLMALPPENLAAALDELNTPHAGTDDGARASHIGWLEDRGATPVQLTTA